MDWIKKEWHIPPLFNNSDESNIEEWEKYRRSVLLKLFSEEMYGITPAILPDKLLPQIVEENPLDRGGKNRYKKINLELWFGDRSITLEIQQWLPFGKGPFPVQMMIDPFEHALFRNYSFYEYYHFFPSDLITDRGYAAVKVNTSTICMDDWSTFREGIYELVNYSNESIPEKKRWGAIGIWAWAGSRCMDYLLTQPEIDSNKVAISGMSRGGKAALWCGAQDERIAIVMSNVSGIGGSAIIRGKNGEHIKDITTNFPHWFCNKFAEYSEDEDSLPIDSHMLLAMIAPRPIYVASASEDIWADIYAEYKGLKLSSEIYKLYYPNIELPETKPKENVPIHVGPIGYHTREGSHDLTDYDWIQYMDFCDKYFMKGNEMQ